ncbi:hypothetical protein HY500_00960 [Candidatus Woesearchaeota archaeon]|nr:hypothetical protein [Candidatus Woesearchaeota archaeon]
MGNATAACMICGIKVANKICKLCGRNVCSSHFGKFLCTDCKSGRS